MRKLVRWILISAVPLLLVPCCLAQVLLVDAEGTSYTVQVVPAAGGHSPDATALSFDRVPLSGAPTSGVIDPTQDAAADRDPILVLAPGSAGPVLIWSRRSGHFDQIAYSRYDGHGWTEAAYFASAPRHQLRPRAGVDASGTGYVVWVETGGSGSVMMATFDPLTGNLISSPQDLFRELVRHSPPQWLSQNVIPLRAHGRPQADDPGIVPEGTNDTPVIPPRSLGQPVSGTVTLSPQCTKAVAAIVRNRALWIGVLQNGVVLDYYRSVIPEGAPERYVGALLQSLLDQHCR